MADTLGVQSARKERKKKSAINYMVLPCANVLFENSILYPKINKKNRNYFPSYYHWWFNHSFPKFLLF